MDSSVQMQSPSSLFLVSFKAVACAICGEVLVFSMCYCRNNGIVLKFGSKSGDGCEGGSSSGMQRGGDDDE